MTVATDGTVDDLLEAALRMIAARMAHDGVRSGRLRVRGVGIITIERGVAATVTDENAPPLEQVVRERDAGPADTRPHASAAENAALRDALECWLVEHTGSGPTIALLDRTRRLLGVR